MSSTRKKTFFFFLKILNLELTLFPCSIETLSSTKLKIRKSINETKMENGRDSRGLWFFPVQRCQILIQSQSLCLRTPILWEITSLIFNIFFTIPLQNKLIQVFYQCVFLYSFCFLIVISKWICTLHLPHFFPALWDYLILLPHVVWGRNRVANSAWADTYCDGGSHYIRCDRDTSCCDFGKASSNDSGGDSVAVLVLKVLVMKFNNMF